VDEVPHGARLHPALVEEPRNPPPPPFAFPPQRFLSIFPLGPARKESAGSFPPGVHPQPPKGDGKGAP